MNLTIKIANTLILAAIMFVTVAFNASALPPGKTGEWRPIDSPQEAKALPKRVDIMVACAGCKTIRPVDTKGIEAWFSSKVKDDCAACGGKLRFTGPVPGKSPGPPLRVCAHPLPLREGVGLPVRQTLIVQRRPSLLFELCALGYEALDRFHMNEGHASLLVLALVDEAMIKAKREEIADENIEIVRQQCVFTTHTPCAGRT